MGLRLAVICLPVAILMSACGPGIPTGQGPARTANLALKASASNPNCLGEFNGSGSESAAYAAGPGAPLVYTSTLKTTAETHLSLSDPVPSPIKISGAASTPQSFTMAKGQLDDTCLNGSFVVSASTTANSSPPSQTAESSPAVAVPAPGFRTVSGPTASGDPDFTVELKLACCPGGGNINVDPSGFVNVTGPARAVLRCPAAVPPTLVFRGTKPKPEESGQLTLRATRAAGGQSCMVGLVQIP